MRFENRDLNQLARDFETNVRAAQRMDRYRLSKLLRLAR
jgi:hypothetical protein